MNFREKLAAARVMNNSVLCVGLDPDPTKFPGGWKDDPSRIYDFCAQIVEATADLAIAFKPQIAYFAAYRAEQTLEDLVEFIHQNYDVPVILDAKRGDIGDTAKLYAFELFGRYEVDAATLSPFLGPDTLKPYMTAEYADRGLFLLDKTSNPGSDWLQNKHLHDPALFGAPGEQVYEYIARTLSDPAFDKNGQIGFVAGSTYPEELRRIRAIAPRAVLLMPGIGAQGGDINATVSAGYHADGEIVVSSSRDVLYGPQGEERTDKNYGTMSRARALATRDELNAAIEKAKAGAANYVVENDPNPVDMKYLQG